jgi:hypothetical protein
MGTARLGENSLVCMPEFIYGVCIMYTERWCRSNTVKVRGTVQCSRPPTVFEHMCMKTC